MNDDEWPSTKISNGQGTVAGGAMVSERAYSKIKKVRYENQFQSMGQIMKKEFPNILNNLTGDIA